ncbi:MAG: hypothetical protein OEX02_06115 [Cyclobacteriaceae bacterium]|nr:hypothetical protein [Cyclobacteriaceae bacterium]
MDFDACFFAGKHIRYQQPEKGAKYPGLFQRFIGFLKRKATPLLS